MSETSRVPPRRCRRQRWQTGVGRRWVKPDRGFGSPVSKMDVDHDYRGWDLFIAEGRPRMHNEFGTPLALTLSYQVTNRWRLAVAWANPQTRRKTPTKPFPGELQEVVDCLMDEEPEMHYPAVLNLVEDLEDVRSSVPANAEAWQRLMRHVRKCTAEQKAMRQSA